MTKKKVKIEIDEEDMNAIEDVFFCKLTKREYEKIRPRLLKIWKELCDQMEAVNRESRPT